MGKLTRGLLVALAVAAIVVVGAAAVPLAADGPPSRTLDTAEFSPDAVVTTPSPASGDVRLESDATGASGTLLVDASHDNRLERTTLEPLLAPVVEAGYDVEYHRQGNLTEALADADALVVVDPADPYGPEEADAVESFVDDGGRLLILAEPTRKQVGVSLLGTIVVPIPSEVTELGSRFDITFGSSYVYDQRRNDANYKRPLAAPPSGATVSPFREDMSGVENVSLFTATSVRSVGDGTTVLETYESGQVAGSDDGGRIPVAVRDGNVLAVGDATFVGADYHSVVDNEVFLAHVVEFLVGGERQRAPEPPTPEPGDEGEPTNESSTDPGNETARLAPVVGTG